MSATDQSALDVRAKSFALASRCLGRAERADAAALYTWCRRADDAIDLSDAPSVETIDRLRRDLTGVYAGRAQVDPAMSAFQRVVIERRIPEAYPHALIDGLAMDVSRTRYDDLQTLYTYCFRVAGTVGLMMAHVLGVRHERALVHAAHLGIAMQLTNIARDVGEDWRLGRLYLPRELLAGFGGGHLPERIGRPLELRERIALGAATERLLIDADRWYESGERGLFALPFRAALAIASARRIYARIGHHVRRARFEPLARRAVVPTLEKLALVAGCLARSLLELPERARHPHRRIALPNVLRFPDDVLVV